MNLGRMTWLHWNYLSNSNVPFTAIEWYHGIEQENRALKVLRGIKGIANADRGLEEYFLTTAKLGNIIKDFYETFGKYEDIINLVLKNARIRGNVEKLWSVFYTCNISFDPSDAVYNILTMTVLPEKEATGIIQVETIGQERYTSFVKEKLGRSDQSGTPCKKRSYRRLLTAIKLLKLR